MVLVVNTASQCGCAGQLSGLQRLHDEYADQGFSVLGFPSDQFRQEPLADEELSGVCERFGVTFPMFAKVAVNGREAHPLYRWLTKFLVERDGRVVTRFAPNTAPADLAADIERALAA